jgi:uncharacterized damage-inducible protein DinB
MSAPDEYTTSIPANSANPSDILRECFLTEFDVAERQLLALANAIPADLYTWRCNDTTRSVGEVLVHVAAGSLSLLSLLGHMPPRDMYGEITGEGEQALWQIVRRNDELEKSVREKDAVLKLMSVSFQHVRASLEHIDKSEGTQSVLRKVYMRLLVHTHEHMGQMIAYARTMGLRVPWEDWRPDRRSVRRG